MFPVFVTFGRQRIDEDRKLCCNVEPGVYCELCEQYSKEAVDAFIGWGSEDLEHFEGCYCGAYDSEEDYARELVDDCYNMEKMMGNLANYFLTSSPKKYGHRTKCISMISSFPTFR